VAETSEVMNGACVDVLQVVCNNLIQGQSPEHGSTSIHTCLLAISIRLTTAAAAISFIISSLFCATVCMDIIKCNTLMQVYQFSAQYS
jgi:hypothetical protein